MQVWHVVSPECQGRIIQVPQVVHLRRRRMGFLP